MNVFESNDYRAIISTTLKARKRVDARFNFQRLAKELGVQKSFVSRALSGQADFNSDHLYTVSRFLGFNDKEHGYVQLLLEHDRSDNPQRKQYLAGRIEEARKAALKTETHLKNTQVPEDSPDLFEYYTDPYVQIVHLALSVPRLRQNPALLRSELNLTHEHYERALTVLRKAGFIAVSDGKISLESPRCHLPAESPLSRPNRILMRTLSLNHLQQKGHRADNYHSSITFSGDEATRVAILKRFMAFLDEARALIQAAPEENVYQMNFDLFPWMDNSTH